MQEMMAETTSPSRMAGREESGFLPDGLPPGGFAPTWENLKILLKRSRLVRIARQQYDGLGLIGRQIMRTDARTTRRYLEQHQTRKLHLGCGDHLIAGWLNSDLAPRSKAAVMVDVTARFPFENGTFDYVYSEHMIEHLPYPQGQHMLRECGRVLKNGGKIRISTPDLSFLIDLYGGGKSPLQEKYIRWVTERFISDAPSYADTFVINNFVRDWGHTFIYDEKTLRFCLERAGFTDIVKCSLNESEDEHLRCLENEARMPEGFVRLETFTLEASKPGRPGMR